VNIGLIGSGNIASYLLENLESNGQEDIKITSVFGRNKKVGEQLADQFGIQFYTDFQEFIQSPIDLVVEAATIDAAKQYMKMVLENDRDLMISSIGVFKDDEVLHEVKKASHKHSKYVYLPSGAIGGLDLLQAANALNGLDHVTITTRKSPKSLGIADINEEQILFEGSARKAVEQFPKNVNVALLLSLAGIGADATMVKVVADPDIEKNTHTIEAKGDFGSMKLTIENNPMLNNPKTSYLAALSILSTLKNLNHSIRIGG